MTSDPTNVDQAHDGDDSRRSARSGPLTGKIAHVTGRMVEGGEPGLPALDELILHNDDGTVLEFGTRSEHETGTLTFLMEIPTRVFLAPGTADPICPICLVEAGTEKEHVPQEALGGSVMTRTCRRCNNDLGARVEPDLQDWFDGARTKVRISHDGEIPGKRHVPTIHVMREKGTNRFALTPAGELTPEAIQMLESGSFWLDSCEPDPRRWRLALLKHAYLAACLYRGDVPESADARAIRADLIAARDTPRRASLPESEAASRLMVYRSGVGRQGRPLALVARLDPLDAGADPEVLISLAGVLFVSWPFTDLPSGTWIWQTAKDDDV